MKNYVLGFCFNQARTEVLLIQKTHPDWQKGLLNGVGGEIENESPIVAMDREFTEETGVAQSINWHFFCKLRGDDFEVFCFKAFCQPAFEAARTVTDEQVMAVPVSQLKNKRTISNLPWLIAAALDQDEQFVLRADYGVVPGYYPVTSLQAVEDFLKDILAYVDNPENWPLTPQEQATFTRMVLLRASKFRHTAAYKQLALILASEAVINFERQRNESK